MADNVRVSNSYASTNNDYTVTTRDTTDGSEIQQVQLDIGTGTSKSPVTPANPLPVTLISTASGIVITQASSNTSPITTATNTILVAAPSGGQKIRVFYISASNSSATLCKVSWRDGVAGTQLYPANLPQYGIFAHNIGDSNSKYWELTANTALYMNTTATGSIDWHVEYKVV